MSGFDSLVAKTLEAVIRKHLGKKTVRVIENRLFEKYGATLSQSIKNFYQLDYVLREYFGSGAEGIEKKFLKDICIIEKPESAQAGWVTIEGPFLTRLILATFGDEDKRKIMESVIDEPQICSQILKNTKIPQTSGYRKINALIKDGFLVPDGIIHLSDGKIVQKYSALFDNMKINIDGNKITIKILVHRQNLYDSAILQTACSL